MKVFFSLRLKKVDEKKTPESRARKESTNLFSCLLIFELIFCFVFYYFFSSSLFCFNVFRYNFHLINFFAILNFIAEWMAIKKILREFFAEILKSWNRRSFINYRRRLNELFAVFGFSSRIQNGRAIGLAFVGDSSEDKSRARLKVYIVVEISPCSAPTKALWEHKWE